MGIDHEAPEPLYVQLADLLRRQITAGEITGRLPSVKTLSQRYEVSHVTAEKAMEVLKREGLIKTVIGKGAYVA